MFGADWVRNDAQVDFANGFIEVYRDARGAKGSSQSFVTVTDKPVTSAMTKLSQNAAYFEQKAPWDTKYKKQNKCYTKEVQRCLKKRTNISPAA